MTTNRLHADERFWRPPLNATRCKIPQRAELVTTVSYRTGEILITIFDLGGNRRSDQPNHDQPNHDQTTHKQHNTSIWQWAYRL